ARRSRRVAERGRQIRAEAAEFRLDALAADLFDPPGHRPARRCRPAPSSPPGWVGPAHLPVPPLRLTDPFAVPTASANGYTGVVTYLLDAPAVAARSRTWRRAAAYREPVQVGDVAHAQLAAAHAAPARG